jgi:hypothetical protein
LYLCYKQNNESIVLIKKIRIMKKKKLKNSTEKAFEIVNSLKANEGILKEKGQDTTFIKTIETSVKKMDRLKKELISLKERLNSKKIDFEQEKDIVLELVKNGKKVLKKEVGKEAKPEKEAKQEKETKPEKEAKPVKEKKDEKEKPEKEPKKKKNQKPQKDIEELNTEIAEKEKTEKEPKNKKKQNPEKDIEEQNTEIAPETEDPK